MSLKKNKKKQTKKNQPSKQEKTYIDDVSVPLISSWGFCCCNIKLYPLDGPQFQKVERFCFWAELRGQMEVEAGAECRKEQLHPSASRTHFSRAAK